MLLALLTPRFSAWLYNAWLDFARLDFLSARKNQELLICQLHLASSQMWKNLD